MRILEMRNSANDDGLNEPLVAGANKDHGHEESHSNGVHPNGVHSITGPDGLTTAQARELFAQWGPNALPENKKSKVRPRAARAV